MAVVFSPSPIGGEVGGVFLEEVRNNRAATSNWFREVARATIVPSGRVAPEYAKYQILHVCQDLSTQLRSTLATSAVFSGLGLGGGQAMGAAAATLVFLCRDATGMAVSLTAAAALAPKLGGDARRYRFAADVAVDLALLLELLSAKRFFVPLLCASAALKALCGVLSGGANAAIGAYFARSSGDLAEVTAKSGAVGTLSGIAGLCLSLAATVLATSVPQSHRFRLSLAAYAALTVAHLVSCAKGLGCLALASIGNPRRFAVVYDTWKASGNAPSPAQLANLDPVVGIPSFSPSLRDRRLLVGTKSFLKVAPEADSTVFFDSYLLARSNGGKKKTTALAMLQGSTPADERRALSHALKAATFESDDVQALRPSEDETKNFDTCLENAGFDLDASIFPSGAPHFRMRQQRPPTR